MFFFLSFAPSQLLGLHLVWCLLIFALFILATVPLHFSPRLPPSDTHPSLIICLSHAPPTPTAARSSRLRQASKQTDTDTQTETHAHGRYTPMRSPFPLKCQGRAKPMSTIRFYQHLKTGPLWQHVCKSERSKSARGYMWLCQWVSDEWINQRMLGNVNCHP